MRSIIYQTVTLPACAEALFDMYMDPARHAAITGQPVVIGEDRGAEFRAFGDMLSGTMLQVVRPRLIVQSWRSPHWGLDDPDSTLILSFVPQPEGGRIELVHVNVVDADFAGVSQGWEKFYWTPWRAYLTSKG